MPKSHKRGGEKAHNKRTQKRKQELQAAKKKMQKMYSDVLQKKFEEFQEQNAKEVDGVKVELNGTEIPFEIVDENPTQSIETNEQIKVQTEE
jgi:hypothetical protein